MTLILQASSTEACSVAPGADMAMATTLIRMTVIGIPLLLALFQFINDHIYDEWEDRLTVTTPLFGGAMILSSFLLLYMYYAGLCTINSTLRSSGLTLSISIFFIPLAIIISITLYAQFKQMIQPGLRFTALMWSIGIACGYVGLYMPISGRGPRNMVGPFGLLVLFGLLGWIGYSTPDDNDDKPEWWGIE